MRSLLCLLILTALTLACGEPVTAPEPPESEGCTYITTLTADNGIILTFTSYLPADHPLCVEEPLPPQD